ncbi:hypothetical protein [Streptomyces sp. NPDC086787]|uniref:hypothetical protein n=1 Tax=Streptomyces sp. NPDC086787 TaxID=3365759 RepID=UPI00382884A2
MIFERVLVQGPLRSTDQVCRELTGFLESCLLDLGHPGAEQVRAVLAPAQPLLRALTARRAFADPAVTLQVAGAGIEVSVSYDPDAEDRIDIPLMKPDPGDEGQPAALVVVHAAGEVEARLRAGAESGSHEALRVQVRSAAPHDEVPVPATPAAPGAPDAPTVAFEAPTEAVEAPAEEAPLPPTPPAPPAPPTVPLPPAPPTPPVPDGQIFQ